MPYTPQHRAKTKHRIVIAARQQFNTHGFEGVSIKQIMEAAGLSHGGFYHHFDGKEDLFAAAVASFTSVMEDQLNEPDTPKGAALIHAVMDGYLSDEHLNNASAACPMIAVPSDVARARPEVQHAFQSVLETMLNLFEANLENTPDTKARELALTLSIISVGGMVLSRALDDDALSDELRDAARNAPKNLGL